MGQLSSAPLVELNGPDRGWDERSERRRRGPTSMCCCCCCCGGGGGGCGGGGDDTRVVEGSSSEEKRMVPAAEIERDQNVPMESRRDDGGRLIFSLPYIGRLGWRIHSHDDLVVEGEGGGGKSDIVRPFRLDRPPPR